MTVDNTAWQEMGQQGDMGYIWISIMHFGKVKWDTGFI